MQTTSSKIIEDEDYDIILLENYPCESKDELHKRERYFIESLDCINKAVPTRSLQEYYKDKKQELSEKGKKYRETNKDIIKVKLQHYAQENKEKLKNYNSNYLEMNKQQIKARVSQTILCSCGHELSRGDTTRHQRTKKHLKLID